MTIAAPLYTVHTVPQGDTLLSSARTPRHRRSMQSRRVLQTSSFNVRVNRNKKATAAALPPTSARAGARPAPPCHKKQHIESSRTQDCTALHARLFNPCPEINRTLAWLRIPVVFGLRTTPPKKKQPKKTKPKPARNCFCLDRGGIQVLVRPRSRQECCRPLPPSLSHMHRARTTPRVQTKHRWYADCDTFLRALLATPTTTTSRGTF